MKKPKALRKGDGVAVLCPSWGGSATFPEIFRAGVENLRQLGLEVIEYPSTRMSADALYRQPEKRADDINRAFEDGRVQGIISTIGGDDSARILQYLDRDTIRSNPKFIMGFSDFTAVSVFIHQLDVVTFNGPSVMAGFAQLGSFPESYRHYLSEYLFNPQSVVPLPAFHEYANGYPNWGDASNVGRLRPWITNDGPHFVQGHGVVTGRLFGGCIEVLEMLKGTAHWPSQDFWNGKLLFLETSDDKPSVEYVKYWLRNYGVMGVFDQLAGVLFGRPRDYSVEEKMDLERTIHAVVSDEFGASDLPIVTNVDFGHTDPQVILPLGIEFEIDTDREAITQLEFAFDVNRSER